jgi:hypothetical protein
MARNPPVDIQDVAGAPAGATNAIPVRLTDGTTFYVAGGGGAGGAISTSAKGTTAAGSPTSTDIDANRQALDVYVRGGGAGGGDVTLIDGVTPTTKANVLGGDSGNGLVIAGARKESTFSISAVGSSATLDTSGFNWVSVHITGLGVGTSVAFQTSNDGTNWVATALAGSDNTTGVPATSTAIAKIYHGPITGRYFRVNVPAISSGTNTGVIELFSTSRPPNNIGVTAAITGVVHVDDNSGSLTVDAPVATPVWVRLSDGAAAFVGQKVMASSLPVAIASDQSTLPVSGPLTDAQLRASRVPVDASGVAVPVTDNAGSLTVDAPVGTPVFTRLSDGAAALIGQKTMAASLPVTVASDQGALPVSGPLTDTQLRASNVGVTQKPATSGGLTIYRLLAAATTNAQSVKASAGQLYGYYIYNASTSAKFVKLYNKASAPTVGTDTPVITLPIPAGSAANMDFVEGIAFATGIALAITGVVTDADATAVAANDVVVNLFYA